MKSRTVALLALFAVAGSAGVAYAGITPAQKCQSGKNKAAGKYESCRHGAEARRVTSGDEGKYAVALQKCRSRFGAAWTKLEQDAGGACPSDADDALILAEADYQTSAIAAALSGGALSACADDLTQCDTDVTTCEASISGPIGRPLKTGQVLCYDVAGTVIACAGTGQDGEIQAGLARAYVDNGNGTITDTHTGLTWEKKSFDNSIHDRDKPDTWPKAFDKVSSLNAASFAGHSDWRLPSIVELQSIAVFGEHPASWALAFDNNCTPGCDGIACSCYQGSDVRWGYASSTVMQTIQNHSWASDLGTDSHVDGAQWEGYPIYVRAVRSDF